MTAKAIFTPRQNSFQFEDRLLLLEPAVKVGRTHKDDRGEADNAFFDSKVLSKDHAVISYDHGQRTFFLQDVGSSNGSFVNNIRLSKAGQESRITRIYSGDVIRFGSDVLDKAKNVTQRAIVSKICLLYPDGNQCATRPTDSKLYRPSESMENIQTVGTIKDSYSPSNDQFDMENQQLCRKLSEIESQLEDREMLVRSVQRKQEKDTQEIAQLRQLIDRQNQDISDLESSLLQAQKLIDMHQDNESGDVRDYYENLLGTLRADADNQIQSNAQEYENRIREIEDKFSKERESLKSELQDITCNEITLLQRIKTLESEGGYARAEVDKARGKETEYFNLKQELEFRIDRLETELERANRKLAEVDSDVVVQRSDDDIRALEEKEKMVTELRNEIGYLKKELISARSGKAAVEDKLNTVQGTMETLNNSISSLTTETEYLKEQLANNQEKLTEKIDECTHLTNLLYKMESQPSQDEKLKAEVEDLKIQWHSAQAEVKTKLTEILQLKESVREQVEIVQQKDIEISRLNGEIQYISEDRDHIQSKTGNVDSLEAEILTMRGKLNLVIDELEVTREDNTTLSREFEKLQVMYNEMKKMRGLGDEMGRMEQIQRELDYASENRDSALEELEVANQKLDQLEAERIKLLREVSQLRSGKVPSEEKLLVDVPEVQQPAEPVVQVEKQSEKEVEVGSKKKSLKSMFTIMVGTLEIYEILLGLLFISIILSWNPYKD